MIDAALAEGLLRLAANHKGVLDQLEQIIPALEKLEAEIEINGKL